jgi:hypothetical protein
MKQKLDEKATGLTPVRNDEVAGANPAESIHVYEEAGFESS